MRAEEKFRRQNPSSDDRTIEDLIDDNATIIPLAEGEAYAHPDYAPAHVEIDGKRRNFLIRQRAAISITRDGSDDPDTGLMETTNAYVELCERIEGPKIEKGETDPCDSIVGTRIADAHQNYCVTKIVRGKRENTSAEFDERALVKLGFKEPYVRERIHAIAASVLGKENVCEKGADLSSIVEHIDRVYFREEKIEGREFERVFCYAGSHWRIRDGFRKGDNEDYTADSCQESVKRGKRIIKTSQRIDAFSPDARRFEDEIVEHLEEEGKGHPDIRNLLRTYVNLKYIIPTDKEKALPTYPNKEAYGRYHDKDSKRRE